jgi:hypothetical protein
MTVTAQESASLHAARAWEWSGGTALASALAGGELSLTCHREHGDQSFARDDVRLPNLTQSIEDSVRQLAFFESNLEAPVRIIKNCNMLAGDGIGLWARRDQIDDLVVLNG